MEGKNEEKKVEYLELVYDLIFVYIIGRNNSLIHHVTDGGFISPNVYMTYFLCTIITLSVWYQTTLYINRYGSNGIVEHLGIFINMYLLYYMADGTRLNWQDYYVEYNVAWGLILLNHTVLYTLKLREQSGATPWEAAHIRYYIRYFLVAAGIVFGSIPVYFLTGLPLAPLMMVFSIVDIAIRRNLNSLVAVDFPHLTERVMLFVVFTFGEMIVGVSDYFSGGVTPVNIYFSLMAFLIVVGLFLGYGFFYDHIIDRELSTDGNSYMQGHIILIFSLNNITTALEFMREPEVAETPKNVFLVVSYLLYFVSLFYLEHFAKQREKADRKFYMLLGLVGVAFSVLMALFYHSPNISVALSALAVYVVFGLIVIYWKRNVKKETP